MIYQKCKKCEKFIQAMIDEFAKYGQNKTASYYRQQCEKILTDNGNEDR